MKTPCNTKKNKGLLLVVLFLMLSTLSRAQVNVTIRVLPPYPLRISDYASRPQQLLITLTNTSRTQLRIQLRGGVTGDNGIAIRASSSYKSKEAIVLGIGETRLMNGSDIGNLLDYKKLSYTGITADEFIRNDGLPEGSYQFCIVAYNYDTNEQLSVGEPAGCSNVFSISSIEPPTLIQPADGAEVAATTSQVFPINWSTPPGSPPTVKYRVRMVEILGNKNPNDAFQTATQPYFFDKEVSGNSYVYTPADPTLTLGRTYALMIQAFDPFNVLSFRNQGRSEITSFTYGKPPVPVLVSQGVGTINLNTSEPETLINNIPFTSIKGRINWYFRKSEEPLTVKPAALGNDYNEAGTTAYPLKNKTVKLIAVFNLGVAGVRDLLLGTGTTDELGNFTIRFIRSATYISSRMNVPYRLEVSGFTLSKNYTLPDKDGTVTNLGEIKALAKTWRLTPTVTDNISPAQVIPNARVDLFRRADFYAANPAFVVEGNLEESKKVKQTIDQVDYVKIASLNPGETATRLFYSDNADDIYLVRVSADDNLSVKTTGIVKPTSSSTVDYTQTYALQYLVPMFKGQVSKKVSGRDIYLEGATVKLFTRVSSFNEELKRILIQDMAEADPSTDVEGLNSEEVVIINGGLASRKPATSFLDSGPGSSSNNSTSSSVERRPSSSKVKPTSTSSKASVANIDPKVLMKTIDINGITKSSDIPLSAVTDQFGNFTITDVPYGDTPFNYIVYLPGTTRTYIDTVTFAKRGASAYKRINFDLTEYKVTGLVKDELGNPVSQPMIRWKSGGSYQQSEADGSFNALNIPGLDTLIVEKLGFASSRIGINVLNGNTSAGTITLKKREGKLVLTVVDNMTKKPIANASVSFAGSIGQPLTDAMGKLTMTCPVGDFLITLAGPPDRNFLSKQLLITVTDHEPKAITISLDYGLVITGVVNADNQASPNTTISVKDMDFITTLTNSQGMYRIVIPSGTRLKASKTGYLSELSAEDIKASKSINFILTKPGFDIAKLLGFKVRIDKITDKGTNKLLTGAFVDLPGNAVFSPETGSALKFRDVEVTLENGIPVPVANFVTTEDVSLQAKVFGMIPIILQNKGNAITILKKDKEEGELIAIPQLNLTRFLPSGIPSYFNALTTLYLQDKAASTPTAFAVLNSKGAFPDNSTLLLQAVGSQELNVYGFKGMLDLPKSSLKKDGFHFVGQIGFGNIPVISGMKLDINDLWIGTNGYVKGISVKTDPEISFSLASWQAKISGLSFNDNGFSLTGGVQISLPASSISTVNFKDLKIAVDQVYGGTFSFPGNGIDVFGIVRFVEGGVPISFGKIGNTQVHYFGGSGKVRFSKLMEDIDLQFFQIQTDGKFAATVKVNQKRDFGKVASLHVNSIGFSTLNGYDVNVDGDLGLSFIPDYKATLGGRVHFGTSGKVSVDRIKIGFTMLALGHVSTEVDFVDNTDSIGFKGGGGFNLAGFGGAEIGFFHFRNKATDVKQFGGDFKISSAVGIPLGQSGLSISKVFGGFKRATTGDYSMSLGGGISLVAMGGIGSVDLRLTMQKNNGSPFPVFVGEGNAVIAGVPADGVSKGRMVLDMNKPELTGRFEAGLNLIPGFTNMTGADLILTLNQDKYFLLGTYTSINAFGIFEKSASVIIGYNIPVNNKLSENYRAAIPPGRTTFTGVSAGTYTTIDFSFRPSADFGAAGGIGAAAWLQYKNYGYLTLDVGKLGLSFEVPRVGLSFSAGSAFGAGAELTFDIAGITTVKLGAQASYAGNLAGGLELGIRPRLSLSAGGAAYIKAGFGGYYDAHTCNTGFNANPFSSQWGASFCFNKKVEVGFDSNKFPPVSVSF